MSTTAGPQLVRPPVPEGRTRWDEDARAVLDEAGGFVRLTGGPGSGKTTLLAEIAARRIAAGGGESVLVLTANRRAARSMRTAISRLLAGEDLRTRREPLVRTVHSYAFGVLRRHAARHEQPPPRLLSGPEQDAVVRELLAGDIEDGAGYWPAQLRQALGLPGFAAELRDLLLRAAERGLGPEHLHKLGRKYCRPEWVAAAKFGQTYEQVTLLAGSVGAQSPQSTSPALDAAELVASALLAFDTDEELLAGERARVRHLLVDDAQHLDPQAFELAGTLGRTAGEFVLAGDPDQTVFSFRGADSSLFTAAEPDRTVTLTGQHRCSVAVAGAVAGVQGRLPGARHPPGAGANGGDGTVQVRLLGSAATEANWIAMRLRRAHLVDGVPWSQMAILTRSVPRHLATLRRALLSAGVPVSLPAREAPLSTQPAVRPLLTLLRCADEPELLDEDAATELLASPLGGADPLVMRRVRRGLRRLELAAGGERGSGELLVDALRDNDVLAALEPDTAAPIHRVAELLEVASGALPDGLEQVLWQVWQHSGLQRRWVDAAARGGHTGLKADRDLDAIVALFDAAATYADRLPRASVAGFADYLAAQQIVGDTLAPAAPDGDAVTVLSAHAAAGREWELVSVAGVVEGSWPDLRTRGTLLGVERLTDLLAGVDTSTVSDTAPVLAEERRLFLVAVSRARRTLLVSAVRGEEEQPSRFLDELAPESDTAPTTAPVQPDGRGLVLAELLGELRGAVCDPDTPAERRERAAAQLARLADAGVPGAHPDSWYGLPEPSSDTALTTGGEPVSVTPSTVELLVTCPLRWLLSKHGGADPVELPATTGSLVHALAQAVAEGADEQQVDEALLTAWSHLDIAAPWFSRREQQRLRTMLRTFTDWLRGSRGELTQRSVETDVDVTLEGDLPVRVRGRVDRLETDQAGRPVVVDLKTSKTAVTAEQAAEHAQLAVYQLAAALGAFEGETTGPGGARLVYVAAANKKTGATERAQPAPDAERLADWARMVTEAASSSAGPGYLAVANQECPTCPVRSACPAHDEGRQVPE